MGWYSAIGRPLFFALPPETAHRLAGSMLGLPLPWARIGHALDDPVLGHDRRRAPAPQPDRARGRLRQDVRPPRAARRSGLRVRGRRHHHARAPGREREATDRSVPGQGFHGERDGSAEPRRAPGGGVARSSRSVGGGPVRQHRRRGDRGRARRVRPAGAARRRRRAQRELSQRLVGPRPRQRGASARTRDRHARPFREAVVREAPAVHDRRRARRGPGARLDRARGRRVRTHVLEHPARA